MIEEKTDNAGNSGDAGNSNDAGNRGNTSLTAVDKYLSADKWAFDSEVCRVFSDMLSRSIPQYDLMRNSVFDVGKHFIQPDTQVVDLGCSRGDALAPFIDEFGNSNRYLGLELSESMLEASQDRFASAISDGTVEIKKHDLREPYPSVRASLTLSVLTLQFTPMEHRQRILRDVYQSTAPGGAFILVEKVLGDTAEINELMVQCYYELKRHNGYSEELIQRKRLALEGVLVPVTARWNEELLRSAGFQQVDCFWRWMNFSAWVGVVG